MLPVWSAPRRDLHIASSSHQVYFMCLVAHSTCPPSTRRSCGSRLTREIAHPLSPRTSFHSEQFKPSLPRRTHSLHVPTHWLLRIYRRYGRTDFKVSLLHCPFPVKCTSCWPNISSPRDAIQAHSRTPITREKSSSASINNVT